MKKPKKMRIVLINHITDSNFTPEILESIRNAIEIQLFQHYAVMWGSNGHPIVVGTDSQIKVTDIPVMLFDNSDAPGALGYHDVLPSGQSYGRVFWHPVRDNGGTFTSGALSLSATCSHEILEILGDPFANWWVDMPDGQTEDALELCDRVENDFYNIGKVAVSNFLTPQAFRGGSGPYDYLGALKAPWDLSPGGYAIRRVGGPKGEVKQVYGETYPDWKKELKAGPRKAGRFPK